MDLSTEVLRRSAARVDLRSCLYEQGIVEVYRHEVPPFFEKYVMGRRVQDVRGDVGCKFYGHGCG